MDPDPGPQPPLSQPKPFQTPSLWYMVGVGGVLGGWGGLLGGLGEGLGRVGVGFGVGLGGVGGSIGVRGTVAGA